MDRIEAERLICGSVPPTDTDRDDGPHGVFVLRPEKRRRWWSMTDASGWKVVARWPGGSDRVDGLTATQAPAVQAEAQRQLDRDGHVDLEAVFAQVYSDQAI